MSRVLSGANKYRLPRRLSISRSYQRTNERVGDVNSRVSHALLITECEEINQPSATEIAFTLLAIIVSSYLSFLSLQTFKWEVHAESAIQRRVH